MKEQWFLKMSPTNSHLLEIDHPPWKKRTSKLRKLMKNLSLTLSVSVYVQRSDDGEIEMNGNESDSVANVIYI